MEFKPVKIKGPDHKSAFFKRLIRHDILIRSQMYHKVIMEYFPKTKQNMVKSLNCLLTLGVKIAHLQTVEGCLHWVRLPAGSLGDEAHFTLSQSLIIHVISHPLLQEGENRLQWNHQLHMRWHKSGTQSAICLDRLLLANYKTCVSSSIGKPRHFLCEAKCLRWSLICSRKSNNNNRKKKTVWFLIFAFAILLSHYTRTLIYLISYYPAIQ